MHMKKQVVGLRAGRAFVTLMVYPCRLIGVPSIKQAGIVRLNG